MCESEISWRGGIFTKFPWVKNAVKIQHLCGFGENSRSSTTNFQDSEDVGEDVISSLGWGNPSTLPISQCVMGCKISLLCIKRHLASEKGQSSSRIYSQLSIFQQDQPTVLITALWLSQILILNHFDYVIRVCSHYIIILTSA